MERGQMVFVNDGQVWRRLWSAGNEKLLDQRLGEVARCEHGFPYSTSCRLCGRRVTRYDR